MFKSLIRTFAIVAAFIAGYMMPGLHVYSWTFKWMLVVMLLIFINEGWKGVNLG